MRVKTTGRKPTVSHPIADRIKSVKEVNHYLKMLVYGRSGTGKTTFLASCPGPILIVDIREQGTTSIRETKDAYVVPIESWEEFEELYWYLKDTDKYKTVCIDTVTALQELAAKKVAPTGTISQRGWGEISGLMKTWLMLFRDLPFNIVFTAQDRETRVEDYDEDNMITPEVGPYVSPSVAKILNAAVGVIGNTYISEAVKQIKKGSKLTSKEVVEYRMRLGPHSKYITKLRRDPKLEGEVPKSIVNPTYKDIVDLMTGEE